MKNLKVAALVLGIGLLVSPRAGAEGFVDMYGGVSKFGTFDSDTSEVNFNGSGSPLGGEVNTDFSNSQALDSYVAGFRVGNTWKLERVNFSLAYDNSFYNVGATPINSTNGEILASNGQNGGTFWKDSVGGVVWQPGADFLVGVPLKYFRAYAGYGLIFPIMFYNYTAFNRSQNTLTYDSLGASGAVGGQFLLGGRWFITKRLNLMVEDRIQSLYSPLVIKTTVENNARTEFFDTSYTFKNLPANQFLIGVGFAWGS